MVAWTVSPSGAKKTKPWVLNPVLLLNHRFDLGVGSVFDPGQNNPFVLFFETHHETRDFCTIGSAGHGVIDYACLNRGGHDVGLIGTAAHNPQHWRGYR